MLLKMPKASRMVNISGKWIVFLLDFPKPDMFLILMFPIGKQEYSSVKVEKRLSEKRDFKVRDS